MIAVDITLKCGFNCPDYFAKHVNHALMLFKSILYGNQINYIVSEGFADTFSMKIY